MVGQGMGRGGYGVVGHSLGSRRFPQAWKMRWHLLRKEATAAVAQATEASPSWEAKMAQYRIWHKAVLQQLPGIEQATEVLQGIDGGFDVESQKCNLLAAAARHGVRAGTE